MSETPEKGRTVQGKFDAGNKFWRNRQRTGRRLMFESPEELKKCCEEYFDWVDDNPLWERKAFSTGVTVDIPKYRPMTLQSLHLHLNMARITWDEYKEREGYKEICADVIATIYEQKFAGAAAGFFNAAIMQRELNLIDKREIDGELTIEVVDGYSDENNDT